MTKDSKFYLNGTFDFLTSVTMFYQGGDPPVSLAMKGTLEVARFVWVLDFVNLLRVCYNEFVPVVSTSFFSFCGRVNFLHFEILAPLSC